MGTVSQDVRYGLRMLRKNPGFAFTAVLTLALGIGANASIFSVVNAVVLRPLPYAAPERLVMVWETMPGNDRRNVAPGNFRDWRAQARSFEQLAGFASASLNLTGDGEPERLSGAAVTTNFFDALGARPHAGRTFEAEDVRRDGGRVVVLGHGLWQRRFGGDPSAVGRTLALDGKVYTVAGVMPPSFRFPARAELWVLGDRGEPVTPSLAAQLQGRDVSAMRDIHTAQAFGRLKDGATVEQARAELGAVAGRLASEHPDTNRGLGVNLVPLHEQVVGGVETPLLILLGGVSLVLLIACANVAGLLLARATERGREMAIRLALGAGRGRLVRQMLTESLMLSLAGGALGLLLAVWCVDLFVALSPGNIPRLEEAGLDARVLGFTLVVSVAVGVVFGLLPALQSARLDPQHALKEGSTRAGSSPRARRARNLLVASEIALAQVLLVGAGLLVTSFVRLQSVDPGFNPENLLTARLALPEGAYASPEKKTEFYDRVVERVSALPGARAAGLVMSLPLAGGTVNRGFRVEGRPEPKADEDVTVDYQLVSPGYLRAMEIPLLRGRQLADSDDAPSPRVVVVNEALARKYFPGEDALGKRIAFGDPARAGAWRTIVGVAADARHESVSEPAFPGVYAPYRQNTEPWSRMAVVVRADSDAAALAAGLRREIAAVDSDLPVSNVQTMEDLMAEAVTRPRFVTALLGLLAAVALLLAAAGIYGLVSYSITERTREFGIRVALGAQARDVFRMVIGQGLWLALAGVGAGLAAALALSGVAAGLLFGVGATDPATYAAVSALLTVVTLAACCVPVRRATKVDPMVALRHE